MASGSPGETPGEPTHCKRLTAAAQTPDIDGYAAALTNFRFLANTTWTTSQATLAMKAAASDRLSQN